MKLIGLKKLFFIFLLFVLIPAKGQFKYLGHKLVKYETPGFAATLIDSGIYKTIYRQGSGEYISYKYNFKTGNIVGSYMKRFKNGSRYIFDNPDCFMPEYIYDLVGSSCKYNGAFTAYYKNGKVAEKAEYNNRELKGIRYKWYEDGQLKMIEYGRNNKTGWWVNGQLKEFLIYSPLITHKKWDTNGSITFLRNDTVETTWHPNHSKIVNNFKKHTISFYDSNGLLIKDSIYQRKPIPVKESIHIRLARLPRFPGGKDGIVTYLNSMIGTAKIKKKDRGIKKITFKIRRNGKFEAKWLTIDKWTETEFAKNMLKIMERKYRWRPMELRNKKALATMVYEFYLR